MDVDTVLGDHLNDLGAEALAIIGDANAKVLIYAEVDEGVVGIIFRFVRPGDKFVRASDDIAELADLIRQAWEHSKSRGPAHMWSGLVYTVENQKMNADLLYGDEVTLDPLMIGKEDELMARYFPGVEAEPY